MNETADHMTLGHQKRRYYLSWESKKQKMTGDISESIQHIYLDIYLFI